MAGPIVIKFYSPVNEGSIVQLLKAVDQKLASGVELCMNFREGASYEEPKLLELVKSLRVDVDNCASVVRSGSHLDPGRWLSCRSR